MPRARMAISIPAKSPNMLFSVRESASIILVGRSIMAIPVTTAGETSATASPMPMTLAIKPLLWAKIAVMPRMIARTADISCY